MRLFISIIALLLFFQGCKTVSNTGVEDLPEADMINNSWILKSMNGEDVDQAFGDQKPSLNINLDENKVTGFGGCNNYFGGITLSGDSIKIGPLGATMMACPEMDVEHKYMRLLESIETFEVNKSELSLLLEGVPVLIYNKKGE